MNPSKVDVAIVGAGPYGLALAAHLREQGTPFRIFGKPMANWRWHMPAGMFLKSEGFASNLYAPKGLFPLAAYCKARGLSYENVGMPVPLETFVSYGMEFQRRFAPSIEESEIAAIAGREGNFELADSDGRSFLAQRVVVATGISHFDFLPPLLSGHDPALVTHSSAHRDLSKFSGKTVAVIGAGASAVDIAGILKDSGADVSIVARRSAINFHDPTREPRSLLKRVTNPRSGLGLGWKSRLCTDGPLLFHAMPPRFRVRVVQRHLGPAPGWFAKQKVVGRVPTHLGASIKSVTTRNGFVDLAWTDQDGVRQDLRADHVIGATGYSVDLRRLHFLCSGLRQQIRTIQNSPALDGHFQSSVPGLYFVGLASANSFGPLTRFAYGAGFTAQRLSNHLTRAMQAAKA
jgi:thioredoxin reductase